MIEQQNVTAGTCGVCSHVDYAPDEDGLNGYAVSVSRGGMVERGYACRPAHLSRVARQAADQLPGGKEWPDEPNESTVTP